MYCSCLMVVGIVFFAILMALEAAGNPFLNKSEPELRGSRIFSLGIAIVINAVVFIGCFACTTVGLKSEAAQKAKEDAEKEAGLKTGELDIF